jgi:hypothetical protein
VKQITLSPNNRNQRSHVTDLTKKFMKLEKDSLEFKWKLEHNSLVLNTKQKKDSDKDRSPLFKVDKIYKKQISIEKNESASPTALIFNNNLKSITGSKISSYLTVNKRLISNKNSETQQEKFDNKNNITKLKQAFSPKHREIIHIHELGNKTQEGHQLNNKKSYKYLETKKNITLERKPSLNVLRNNLVTSINMENKSPYFTNNLQTYKNPSKFLTQSLSIKTNTLNASKNEKSEKLEKNSSCKNLSNSGNYRIINLKDKVVMKTFSPKPAHRSPTDITENFGLEIKERVLNKKQSEKNFTLEKLNIFLNKPKRSSSSKLNVLLNETENSQNIQNFQNVTNIENKNKSDESLNSRTHDTRKGSIGNKNKSLISQYGIPTVSTTLCDTGINQQFITNENGTLSASVSFTNSEGSYKAVRSLSEARKSKQIEKAAFGNFNSITKNYQDCINNALNSITKELRKMDTIKSSVSASVGV